MVYSLVYDEETSDKKAIYLLTYLNILSSMVNMIWLVWLV